MDRDDFIKFKHLYESKSLEKHQVQTLTSMYETVLDFLDNTDFLDLLSEEECDEIYEKMLSIEGELEKRHIKPIDIKSLVMESPIDAIVLFTSMKFHDLLLLDKKVDLLPESEFKSKFKELLEIAMTSIISLQKLGEC